MEWATRLFNRVRLSISSVRWALSVSRNERKPWGLVSEGVSCGVSMMFVCVVLAEVRGGEKQDAPGHRRNALPISDLISG